MIVPFSGAESMSNPPLTSRTCCASRSVQGRPFLGLTRCRRRGRARRRCESPSRSSAGPPNGDVDQLGACVLPCVREGLLHHAIDEDFAFAIEFLRSLVARTVIRMPDRWAKLSAYDLSVGASPKSSSMAGRRSREKRCTVSMV